MTDEAKPEVWAPVAESALDQPGPVVLEVQASRIGELQVERAQLENQDLRQDIGLRRAFANAFLALHIILIVAVVAIVSLTGAQIFVLSDKVLIALIGGTVAELVGLIIAVVKYLFPGR